MSRTRQAHHQRPDAGYGYDTCSQWHCEASALKDIDVQLCDRHLAKAWAAYELMNGTPDVPMGEDPPINYADKTMPGAVYFIRKADLLKIGWTSNVAQRMHQLKPDAVMHVEAGTKEDEQRYHRMFKDHLREGREWFDYTPETEKAVNAVRTRTCASP